MESVSRLAYGMVLNFAYMEHLGPLLRAKLSGQSFHTGRRPRADLRDAIVGIIVGARLAVTYAASLWQCAAGTGNKTRVRAGRISWGFSGSLSGGTWLKQSFFIR